MLADKAYDADRIRELIQDQGATPNIPPKSNRKWKPCFSKRLYRERNLIERFFSKLKHFRRVATRDDKLAANFLAMVQIASMRLWLRAYESYGLVSSCSGQAKVPIRALVQTHEHLLSQSPIMLSSSPPSRPATPPRQQRRCGRILKMAFATLTMIDHEVRG